MSDDAFPGRFHLLPKASAILTLGFGFAFSSVLAVWLQSTENQREEALFQAEANERVYAFENGLLNMVDAITAINELLNMNCAGTRDQFRSFALPLLKRHPYIASLTFRPANIATSPERRPASARGYESIRTAATSCQDGPALPATLNRQAVGGLVPDNLPPFAPATSTALAFAQEEAMGRARDTSGAATTQPFEKEVNDAGVRYFSIVLPAYPKPFDLATASSAAPALVGYTLAVIDGREMARDIFLRGGLLEMQGLAITVRQGMEESGEAVMYRHDPSHITTPGGSQAASHVASGARTMSHTVDAAGGQWYMTVSSTPPGSGIAHVNAWMVLLGGSALTVLLAAYLHSLSQRAAALARINSAQHDDIAALRAMEKKMVDAQVDLQQLASHQERMLEDERKRIAREIHDDLGQNLLALRIDVTLLEQQASQTELPAVNAKVRMLLKQIDVTVSSVRAIINHLRPSALDLGLSAAIEWLVRKMNERSKVEFTLLVENEEALQTLSDEQATSIFRIVQEALSNIMRHANAQHAQVRLSVFGERLQVVISDDGIGSYPNDQRKPRSFGLLGIRERVRAMGGDFSMVSAPNQGTTLSLSLPVLQKPDT